MKYLFLFLALSGCTQTPPKPPILQHAVNVGECYGVDEFGGYTYKVTAYLKYGFITARSLFDANAFEYIYWREDNARRYEWHHSDCLEDIAAAEGVRK